MEKIKLGIALCGSFCTFSKVIEQMENLTGEYDIYPIMSGNASSTDTRFGTAQEHINIIEKICGHKVIKTIDEAEPIGPKNMLDILLVAPCTGNTVAKLANSITDTTVTMAVKSHLRGQKPIVLAVATNDGLAGSVKNIGVLLNLKNYYFVPFKQDDYIKKPFSLVAEFTQIDSTLKSALAGKQIQPIIM